MEMQNNALITVPEAAKLLGLGKTYIYKLIGQGQLPVVRFGRRVLIPVKHLNLYIETFVA